MITATESIALRRRVIGAHGAVVRYALDCNWCARPLFVRDYYGFRAGESETCTCGALNYVHLNEHGEPVACMEDEGESRREAGERLVRFFVHAAIAVYRRERRSPQSTTTDSSTNPSKKEQ